MAEGWPGEPLADVAERRDALRHAASIPGADTPALFEAALTELDGVIEALAGMLAGGTVDVPAADGTPEAGRAERRLLHAAFQQTPVALFLLEQDGTIRRANNAAAALIGSPAGYATGKPLTAFVDMPSRPAVKTQLAAVARTGKARQAPCRLLTPSGTLDVTLTAAAVELPGDPPLLVVTTAPGADSPPPATGPATRPRPRPATRPRPGLSPRRRRRRPRTPAREATTPSRP